MVLCTPSKWAASLGGNFIGYSQGECSERNKPENPVHMRCRKRDSDRPGNEAKAAEETCHNLVHLAERARLTIMLPSLPNHS